MALATLNNRKLWIGSLLLLTVLAAIWPLPNHEPVSPETGKGTTSSRSHGQATMINLAFAPLVREMAPDKQTAVDNLFPQQTWTQAPAAKQAPVAPPLPFTFGGRYTDGNKVTLFLIEGNQMYRVQQGETVRENYRVDKIEQAFISFTYLPLGTTQILPTGVLLP